MLQKKLNLKGLRKRVLKLEYANKLISPQPPNTGLSCKNNSTPKEGSSPLNKSSEKLNYRILILRNAPIEDAVLKQCLTEIAVYEESVNSKRLDKYQTKIFSKCIKKNILKKIFYENNVKDDRWLQCKFMYWVGPEASSLAEQLIQLNHLKSCIRAEPKEAFLGCLLESRPFINRTQAVIETPPRRVNLSQSFIDQKTLGIQYKYYYPAEILNLCDLMDKMSGANKATGLEVLGQLLQTIESSVSSMSLMLALKTKKDEESLPSQLSGQDKDKENKLQDTK